MIYSCSQQPAGGYPNDEKTGRNNPATILKPRISPRNTVPVLGYDRYHYALWFFFSLSPFNADFAWPFFIVIFLAIALGLICYFQGKAESRNTEEETEKEKLADLSDADQEEELSEPKHAQYH